MSQEISELYRITFAVLPCIVIDFFLNNQPDALIISILSCHITLHVSGNFFAHHQEFSTVHSALISFMQYSDDRFQAESGWNCVPSWLCLEAVIRILHETYQCRMYSIWQNKIGIISASGWLFKNKTFHQLSFKSLNSRSYLTSNAMRGDCRINCKELRKQLIRPISMQLPLEMTENKGTSPILGIDCQDYESKYA